jgi:hypothetical protein
MPPPIPCNSSSISSLAANKTSFTEILKAAYLATNKKIPQNYGYKKRSI